MKHKRIIIWLFRESEIIGCCEPKCCDFPNISFHLIQKKVLNRTKQACIWLFSCYEWLSLDAICAQFFILKIYIPFCLLFLCFLQSEMGMKAASSGILSCEPSFLRIIKIWQDGFIPSEQFWLKWARKQWKYWGKKTPLRPSASFSRPNCEWTSGNKIHLSYLWAAFHCSERCLQHASLSAGQAGCWSMTEWMCHCKTRKGNKLGFL